VEARQGKEENTVMADDGKTRTQLLDDVAALRHQLTVLYAARLDAESEIETVREPLVVLGADLQVLSANRAFYHSKRQSLTAGGNM